MTLIISLAVFFVYGFISWLVFKKSHCNHPVRKYLVVGLALSAVVNSIILNDAIKGLSLIEKYRIPFLFSISIVSILYFTIIWHQLAGWLVSIGIVSNMLAIAANGWKMPVFRGWDSYYFATIKEIGPFHIVMTQADRFKILGDYIAIRIAFPYGEISNVWSLGDILLVIGSFLLYKTLIMRILSREF